MNITISTSQSGLNAIAALHNGGSLNIYSGTQPANADTALSGNTLLATFALATPAYATATSASPSVAVLNGTPITATALATGTATFGRFVTSSSVTIADDTVGTSGADITLSDTAITSGGLVTLTSYNLIMPNH